MEEGDFPIYDSQDRGSAVRSQVMGQASLVPSMDHANSYTCKVWKTHMRPFYAPVVEEEMLSGFLVCNWSPDLGGEDIFPNRLMSIFFIADILSWFSFSAE